MNLIKVIGPIPHGLQEEVRKGLDKVLRGESKLGLELFSDLYIVFSSEKLHGLERSLLVEVQLSARTAYDAETRRLFVDTAGRFLMRRFENLIIYLRLFETVAEAEFDHKG